MLTLLSHVPDPAADETLKQLLMIRTRPRFLDAMVQGLEKRSKQEGKFVRCGPVGAANSASLPRSGYFAQPAVWRGARGGRRRVVRALRCALLRGPNRTELACTPSCPQGR